MSGASLGVDIGYMPLNARLNYGRRNRRRVVRIRRFALLSQP
jgi:hypothetical protein